MPRERNLLRQRVHRSVDACTEASRSDSATLIVLIDMWMPPVRNVLLTPASPNATASTAASSASIVLSEAPAVPGMWRAVLHARTPTGCPNCRRTEITLIAPATTAE